MSRRTFLFLQGLASPFFHRLAGVLRASGHEVLRVNLSGADVVFWPESAINFRGTPAEWPGFVGKVLRERQVSDVVVFGDCRPYHRVALEAAQQIGAATHIFEEGYLRPNWITLEHGGTNGHSAIPCDPDAIRTLASQLPEPVPPVDVGGSYFKRALWDVTANVVGLALWPLFPRYRWHGTEQPIVEYFGWLRRFAQMPLRKRQTAETLARVVEAGLPYYLAPLQLHSDYQIRAHSPYGNAMEAIEEIVTSFVAHAPPQSHLLFKLHPLDNTLFGYPDKIARIAKRLKVAERLHLISGGELPKLITRSSGVVLVNSSLGTLALEYGCPVKALGTAIYDMPGLTFQGPLDAFWTTAGAPDAELYRNWRRAVLALTQVNGGFFSDKAIEVGVRGVADRMVAVGSRAAAPTASAHHGKTGITLARQAIVPGE